MANILLDCFKHAFSYLNEGGGEPPDPGGGGGGGCEGQDNCDDDGSSSCDEEFFIVKCVCLADGTVIGGGSANSQTDNAECDEPFVCVQEGTTGSDLEANIGSCDTGCGAWTSPPTDGDSVCGFPVVTYSNDLDCNAFGCTSKSCTTYKCEDTVDSETGQTFSECVFSRAFHINTVDDCNDHLNPGEYLTDNCNNECEDPPPPPPDTDKCIYYYCANFNNCNDTFEITVPAGDPCLPIVTTSVNGSDQTGYTNQIACRTQESGCNNVYDGDPVPQLVVIWDEHFPEIMDLPPAFFCDGFPPSFSDPGWGGLSIQDEGGEVYNLENLTFTPVSPDGTPRSDISFSVDAAGAATLSFSQGANGDINTGPFTFAVDGPGIENVILGGYPNGDPNLRRNNCDNYEYACIQQGLCGKTYNDIGGGTTDGIVTDCNVYACTNNTDGTFSCTPSTKPKSFFGLGVDSECPAAGTQIGSGFARIVLGDSCPTGFCDQENTVPVPFSRCLKNQGVTTGECEEATYAIPSYMVNTLGTGSPYLVNGVVWRKGTCAENTTCPNDQYECTAYRCNGTSCEEQVFFVANQNQCTGTQGPNNDYTAGSCDTVGNDVCNPPTTDLICDAYRCVGTTCDGGGQAIFPGEPEGTTCADKEGTVTECFTPGFGQCTIGSCSPGICDVPGGEECDIAYCDEQQPPQCQVETVPVGEIFYNGNTLTTCDEVPAGTSVSWNGIPAIMGPDCPTFCNGSPLPPPPTGGSRDNLPENLRKYSDETLRQRANNYMSTLYRLNNEESILDPVGSNRAYQDRTSFVPVRNTVRLDVFAEYVHCTIAELLSNLDSRLEVPNAIYSNINLEALFRSLRRDIRYKLENVKDATGTPIKNGVLRALKRALISNTLSTFRINNLPSRGFETEEYPIYNEPDQTELISLINEKAKPIHPKFYTGYNKERMRLWKSLATDLRKAVPLLRQDGTLEYEDVRINDKFDIVLSDDTLSAIEINPGDIVKYTQSNGSFNAVDLDSDKERAFMLDRADYARAFTKMGEKLLTKIEVSSVESELIEENYSLSTPRQEIYFLKIDLESIEEDDSTNPLIRVTKIKYNLVQDDADIDEFVRYHPWPYETYYIGPDDPFFDHLESSEHITATFKDITFEGLVGYRDDSVIMPRRIPWYITIVPTDDISKLLSEGKTFLSDYNKRFFYGRYLPYYKTGVSNWEPNFLSYNKQVRRREGFDPRDNYVGTLRFGYNKPRFKQLEKQYNEGSEKLPRKETPVRKLLRTIKEVKDTSGSFVDEKSEFIPWPEIYRRMDNSDIQSLKFFEFDSWNIKESKLSRNTLAKDETVRGRYSKISYTPSEKLNDYDKYEKPPIVPRATKLDGDFKEETPEILP